MRSLTLLSVLLCAAASAQNWALLNPAYKYNYSNDGSDTISNQIFVTHIDTLGVDSFRYGLNRIGVVCDTCGILTSNCGTEDTFVVQDGSPQFLGIGMLNGRRNWWLYASDTLLVETDAHLGASWEGPSGISALVISEETEQVFGESDSVKRIAYTSGDTLAISKDHGTLSLASGPSEFTLIGIEGLEVGAQFPDILHLFDYAPNDMLQYEGDGNGTNGSEYWETTTTTKYIFLSRSDTVGRTDYSVRNLNHFHSVYYSLPSFTFSGSYTTATVDTFALSIVHDHWTPENSFGCPWLNTCWPKAVCAMSEDEWPGPATVLLDAWLIADQRYVIEAKASPQDDYHRVLCGAAGDSTRWLYDPNGEFYRTYVEGIGLTSEGYFYFESGNNRNLVGYVLDGVQMGTITPDWLIAGAEEMLAEPALRVFPVPTADELHITTAHIGRTWTILDLFGRPLQQGRLNSGSDLIDTSKLPVGAYLLQVDDGDRLAFARFIIDR